MNQTSDPVIASALSSLVLDRENTRQVATVRAGDLKHPPNWVRQDTGAKDDEIALGRSYRHRANNLILISPDGTIRDGNRRVAGIIADSGPDTQVRVCITSEQITPEVSLEIMVETASHTKPLTPYEQYLAFSEWLRITKKTAKELAQRMRLNEPMVSKILSLSECIPEVHQAAREGLIGSTEWHALKGSSDQLMTLNLRLSGQIKTRDELVARVKRDRKPAAPESDTVKMKSIVIAMPQSRRLVLQGGGIDLATGREMLVSALKLVDKAIEDGLTAKNAQGIWKDTSVKPKPERKRKARAGAVTE